MQLATTAATSAGKCRITINNGTRVLDVDPGNSLFATLTQAGLSVPSICGGRGICGRCKVKITSGGGPLPERPQTGPQRPAPGNDLTQLGRPAEIAASPEDAELECVPNPKEGTEYLIRFTAAEFTSLCPVTGQPDFAHLVIDYVPDEWIVESKSLKLYLSSFRNHGAFHEDCTITIAEKIITTAEPHWIRIGGYWYPRGGIPIDVFFQSGSPPEDLWLPDQDVAPYRGRG